MLHNATIIQLNSSNLTSVYPIAPVFHSCPPSTPFLPYGTRPLSPRVQTISTLPDPLYSKTPFIFQLFYKYFNSITRSIRYTLYYQTSQKQFVSRMLIFLLLSFFIPQFHAHVYITYTSLHWYPHSHCAHLFSCLRMMFFFIVDAFCSQVNYFRWRN